MLTKLCRLLRSFCLIMSLKILLLFLCTFKCELMVSIIQIQRWLNTFAGILEALKYIHSRNVIYRDVRPGLRFFFGIGAKLNDTHRAGNLGWDDKTEHLSLFNFEDATFFDAGGYCSHSTIMLTSTSPSHLTPLSTFHRPPQPKLQFHVTSWIYTHVCLLF